ncbi:MAG: hypothetical protein KJP21_06990 [Bacteroidia bacterium]|nr:hypothetical protein [Bacteroidia bacterium]NNJ56382.1 hypothetical protein [Bacteroidia bacterium]
MGNWDDFYYEIHEEVTSLGLHHQFNNLVNKLNDQEIYQHQSIRDKWSVALNMIKNNEY